MTSRAWFFACACTFAVTGAFAGCSAITSFDDFTGAPDDGGFPFALDDGAATAAESAPPDADAALDAEPAAPEDAGEDADAS